MVRVVLAVALAFATQPALAQRDFPEVETARITGASVEQQELHRIPSTHESGLDDAIVAQARQEEVLREARECALDAGGAQRVAAILKRARPSAEQWEGLGADTVIRFSGPGEPLIAVIASVQSNGPYAETRIFFAGKAAFLAPADKAAVGEVLGKVGCPFFEPAETH